MRNIAFNIINEGLRLAQAGFKFISDGSGPASGSSYLRPDGTSYYKQPGGTDFYIRP
jgi:hypothetical protein